MLPIDLTKLIIDYLNLLNKLVLNLIDIYNHGTKTYKPVDLALYIDDLNDYYGKFGIDFYSYRYNNKNYCRVEIEQVKTYNVKFLNYFTNAIINNYSINNKDQIRFELASMLTEYGMECDFSYNGSISLYSKYYNYK